MPRLLDKQRVAAQVQGAAESLNNRHGLTASLRQRRRAARTDACDALRCRRKAVDHRREPFGEVQQG